MKLRLPQALIAALLVSSLPVDAQWAADRQTSGHAYFYCGTSASEHYTDFVLPNGSNGVNVDNSGYSNIFYDHYATIGIVAGVNNQAVDITTVHASDGQTFLVAQNPWPDNNPSARPNINLQVGTLEFAAAAGSAEAYGSGALTVAQGQTASVAGVSGTLTGVTNEGTLTLSGNMALSGAIVNTGSLNISGATFAVNSLDNFETVGDTSFSDGANGYITTDFRLASGGTIDAGNAKVSLNGAEATNVTTDASGNVLFHATDNSTYYINENTAETLLNATGAGTLKLTANAVLSSTNAAAPAATSATGTLIVGNGSGTMVKLVIGRAETPGGSYVNNYANIKSFSNVTLDNGELWFQSNTYEEAAIHNLTVTENGGKLSIWDTQSENAPALLLGGKTTLDGKLTLATTWKNKVTFDALTGSGTLEVSGSTQAETVTVNSIVDTLGKIDFSNGNGTLNLTTGSGKVTELLAGKGTINLLNGTRIGQLSGGNANNNRSAKINIAAGAEVAIDFVNIAWGINSFTIDGVLNSETNFKLATSDNYAVSGKGTINTTQLELANWGAYTLAVKQINIGSGGITGNNNRERILSGTTIGATADWTNASTINFKLEDTVTFDTKGHNIAMNGVLANATDAVGSLVKDGEGTLTLGGNNTFTGSVTVNAGTLKINNTKALGNIDSSRDLVINTGAKLDVNGNEGTGAGYTVTLAGGTLTNMGTGKDSGKRQFVTALKLTKDSTIDAVNEFGLIGSNYAATSMNLGSHTLTKTGSATYYIANADIQGTGTFKVEAGALDFFDKQGLKGSFSGNFDMAGGTVTGTVHLGSDMTIKATAAESTFGAIVDAGTHNLTASGNGDLNMTAAITGSGSTLVKEGNGTLTVTGSLSGFSGGSITAQDSGSLVLKNLGSAASFNLNNLTLEDSATVSAYTGTQEDAQHEANLTVTGTLTASNSSTLNANLELAQGSSIDIAEGGLHMGSSLTLSGNNIGLSQDIVQTLNDMCDNLLLNNGVANMTVERGLTLFTGVDSFNGSQESVSYSASTYFDLSGVQRPWDFIVKFEANTAQDGGTVSIWLETPEPATATLSLLALAALAARRKRK